MKNLWSKIGLAFGIVLLIAELSTGLVQASSINSGDGYRISPVRSELSVSQGSSKVVDLYVQNVTKAPEDVQTIVDDFVASSQENGTPSLLLNGQAAPSHGLKQYIKVENANFVLQPQQQQTVKVLISIPKNAAPGGYYAAVRFAPSGINSSRSVNLSASVASLILVTVPGNYIQSMNVSSFNVASNGHIGTFFTSNKNLQAIVSFYNAGQIQSVPFGKVALLKGNQQLGTFAINKAQGNVLPESIRKFSVNLAHVGTFGKYTVEGNFGYGTSGQLLSVSKTFYIVPYYLIVGFIVLIVIVLILIAISIRRYHHKHN